MKRALALALLVGLATAPVPAAAHPLDEVVQGAYLTLAPGEVRLQLDLTPGWLVAQPLLAALDPDGDRRITEAEARAYAARVLAQSTLTLDGAPVQWRLDKVAAPSYAALSQAGEVLKIYAVAARPERSGSHILTYDNRYRPAASQCVANVFLQPGPAWRYQVTGQQRGDDGRRLAVGYKAART